MKEDEDSDRHRLLRLGFEEKKVDDKLKVKKKEVNLKFDELRQKNENFLREQFATRQKLEESKLKTVVALDRKLYFCHFFFELCLFFCLIFDFFIIFALSLNILEQTRRKENAERSL